MLIKQFRISAEEAASHGLDEVDMSRLGRFVALAGKNGSGKTRVLGRLEDAIIVRERTAPHLVNWEIELKNYQNALESDSGADEMTRGFWEKEVEKNVLLINEATFRITLEDPRAHISPVRFVPKALSLADPRTSPKIDSMGRFNIAKNPGVNGYEQVCLYYIQHLQARWWNCTHQKYEGGEEILDVEVSYLRFVALVKKLLGFDLGIDADGTPTFNRVVIQDAGLSDGQKVILQLAVAIHAQSGSLNNAIFLLDEPENHLHPSAAIELLQLLYEMSDSSQIWVATHSVSLLSYIASVEPMSIWYVNKGAVSNAGRNPSVVLNSLLGGEDGILKINAFTGLPAQLAAVNYAVESLLEPKVVKGVGQDPQVSQIQKVLTGSKKQEPISILDFGAGKGRLLEGLAQGYRDAGMNVAENIEYFAYDMFFDDKNFCETVVAEYYGDQVSRYFNSREELFSSKDDLSIDVVVMCNVLHEISPRDWVELFAPRSLLGRCIKDDGYLLLVEDQRIPVGEKAHEYGFIVLDTSHLRTLFAVTENDVSSGLFVVDDARGDGRLKAHLIAKQLLERMTVDTIKVALKDLSETAKSEIKRIRHKDPSYANGQLNGFWTQQFANALLFLGEM